MADTPANENTHNPDSDAESGADQANEDQESIPSDGPGLDEQTSEDLGKGRRETIVRLMEAIQNSERQGVPSRIVHESLLALSVSVFVGLLGREGAALLVERLPEKIRNGEFGDGIDPSAE